MSIKVIDLFAGCGGFSLGFIKEGFIIEKAVEFDPMIANTYKLNHPEIKMIVDDIKNVDNSFKQGEADVIIGGPPCQGFSMAGARIRQNFTNDPRNYLFKHYLNIVSMVKPKVFVMENVKGMLTMKKGKIFEEIKQAFNTLNEPYQLFSVIIKTSDFGIPQKRERLIVIGTTLDTDINKLWEQTKNELNPSYFDTVNIHNAIGNLPTVSKDGVVDNPTPQTNYEKYLACTGKTIKNHWQAKHSKTAVERMKLIKTGENYTVLDETIKSVHSGSYGRMDWHKQSVTITTRFDTPTGGRFIHPTENRTLSPREAARIQSFPDDFVFYGGKRSISRQIGNAVPPKISFFLARLVKNILTERNKQ